MPMPSWGVHCDHDALEAVAEKLRHSNPAVATKFQPWLVILVNIASGRMTPYGAVPDGQTLQSMRGNTIFSIVKSPLWYGPAGFWYTKVPSLVCSLFSIVIYVCGHVTTW